MSQLYIDDIKISYQGCDLSQFGLFPLVAWYLLDVLKLREYFQQVTVNKTNQQRKPKKRDFTDEDMCIGLLALLILGSSRISQITERLSNRNWPNCFLYLASLARPPPINILVASTNRMSKQQDNTSTDFPSGMFASLILSITS